MTLPISGLISLSDINIELGKAANVPIALNDSNVRTLLAKATGQISLADGFGKSKISGYSFISGYEPIYGYYGWNGTTATGFGITGTSSSNPIPMSPYGGSMYTILSTEMFGRFTIILGTAPATNIYVTINGIRYYFEYFNTENGFNYWGYSDILVNSIGNNNTIMFG